MTWQLNATLYIFLYLTLVLELAIELKGRFFQYILVFCGKARQVFPVDTLMYVQVSEALKDFPSGIHQNMRNPTLDIIIPYHNIKHHPTINNIIYVLYKRKQAPTSLFFWQRCTCIKTMLNMFDSLPFNYLSQQTVSS